jgi:hypothetical protein
MYFSTMVKYRRETPGVSQKIFFAFCDQHGIKVGAMLQKKGEGDK